MESDAKRSHMGSAVDRISILPRNLIDLILERLPVHDAARTSVLSNTWRNIWGTQSHLVFDEKFFSQLVPRDNIQARLHKATKIINSILLLYNGPILKFHLSIPEDLPLHWCQDTDIWIKHISNKGVRILELFNKLPDAYTLPSYLFSSLELTDLWLKKCILHPPVRFGSFCNLKSVELENVIITADLSMGSQLEELVLRRCSGIEHFGCQFKCNNNLTRLEIIQSGAIDWRWFEYTQNVKVLVLLYECDGYIIKKVINFDKLVDNMPKISYLHLDSYFLQLLEPGAANSWKLTTAMENLKLLYLYEIQFHRLVQIQYVVCLIQSSPNLQYLRIYVLGKPEENSLDGMESVAAVEQYLQLPNFTNMIIGKLETVKIDNMEGSKAELQLIKLLLASSPSLKWMKLKYDTKLSDPEEKFRISRELLHFTRASTVAHVIWI